MKWYEEKEFKGEMKYLTKYSANLAEIKENLVHSAYYRRRNPSLLLRPPCLKGSRPKLNW